MRASPQFIDTNVLAYLLSEDVAKAQRAEELLSGGGTISVQVLNELANVARRKCALAWRDVVALLDTIRALVDVVPVDLEVHELGIALASRHQLSIYDAMIVGAALNSGCATLWSEDMQDGLVIDRRLTIRDPFAGETTRR